VRLATRLTILLAALTIVVAFSVGWFAVSLSTRSQYSTLDASINSVVVSGLGHPNSALSDALNVVEQQHYDLTLAVIDPTGAVTQVNAASVAPSRKLTMADVRVSLGHVRSVPNLPGFRIRSLNVGAGAFLVVSGSTAAITKENGRLALSVALVGVLAALVMLLLARLIMRRDLLTMEQLIDYASDVARGTESGLIPPGLGSRDVRELQAALATMVEALRRRIAIEVESVEAMQQFIGDASHELRTPLTVIKGYNELLSGPNVTETQQRKAVERVQREIERMDSLITDLLLLAELREVPQSANDRVALSALLVAHEKEFRVEHPRRTMTSSIEPSLFVRGRNDYLDRLVVNAFSNIVRHTGEDVPVQVTLRRVGSDVELRIEDGGEGLPQYGLRPHRFARLDSSRSRVTGGSGLGMSIMLDIAEALGGTMTTSKSPLGGLALVFAWPVA
jgi:two-component system OmpR family sensor kinase